jgi:hypothetical protein
MKKNFTYEDRILAEKLFDNEFEKVFLNLKARLRNAPEEVRDGIIERKEKDIMRRLISKYMY